MTDERYAEMIRTSFTVRAGRWDYEEPTLVDGVWYISHADHQDLRIRLAAENDVRDLADMMLR